MPKLPIENFGDFFFGEISERIISHYENIASKCVTSVHINPKLIKKWIEVLHTAALKEKTRIKDDDYLIEKYQYLDDKFIIAEIDSTFQKYHLGFTLRYLDVCISKNKYTASDLVNTNKIKGIFEQSFQIAKKAYDNQCDIAIPDSYTFLICEEENTRWVKLKKEDPYFIDLSDVTAESIFQHSFSKIENYYQLRSNEYLKKQKYYESFQKDLRLKKRLIFDSNGQAKYDYNIDHNYPPPTAMDGFEDCAEIEKILLTFGISEDRTLICLDSYISMMLDDDIIQLIQELKYEIYKVDYASFGMDKSRNDKFMHNIFNPTNELIAYKITKVLNLPIPLKVSINQSNFHDELRNHFIGLENIEVSFGRVLFIFDEYDLPYFAQFLNIGIHFDNLDHSKLIRLLRDGVYDITADDIWESYINIDDLINWLKDDPARDYQIDYNQFRKLFISDYMLLDAYHTVIDIKKQRAILINKIISDFKIKKTSNNKYSIDLYDYIVSLIQFHNFDYYLASNPWVILDQYFAIKGKIGFEIRRNDLYDLNYDNVNYAPDRFELDPSSELITEVLYDQLAVNRVEITGDIRPEYPYINW